jgi:sec-independent protein translocase protein TatC
MANQSTKNIGNPDQEMHFLDHVSVLRGHLVRIVLGIFLFAIIAFIYRDFIFTDIIFASKSSDFATFKAMCWLSRTLGMGDSLCIAEQNLVLQNLQMAGQFNMSMWASFIIGIILSFPYTLWEIWRFIAPGLKDSERKNSKGFLFWASLLFFLGVLFGYYVIVPLSINFLGTFEVSGAIQNNFALTSYVSLVTNLVISCGLLFELPIIIFFLAKLGLVDDIVLKKYRKHAIVITLILSAIITPPDFLSQILVALPVMLLYEIGIRIAKITK